eukprot:6748131-Prymnesium_polylepis.1
MLHATPRSRTSHLATPRPLISQRARPLISRRKSRPALRSGRTGGAGALPLRGHLPRQALPPVAGRLRARARARAAA